jgi:phosphocarrier protein HPr
MRLKNAFDDPYELTSTGPCAKRRRDLGFENEMSAQSNVAEKMDVVEREFIVGNKLGIHARVAAQIVKVANQFQSDIWILKSGNKVNGKSILDLLTLVCPHGSTVNVSACGPDASDALKALAILFQTKFGEM